jgi:NDP-sugar pyrophosphorylase family protein
MKAVILAGGLGTRLRPFTEVIPKPLLPLGGKAIIEHQIFTLRDAGVSEVFLATNYKSDLIEAFVGDGSKFGLPVRISREDVPLGTAGPLRLLAKSLDSPFLVMNGDILTNVSFRKFYTFALQQKSILTVATKIITTPFRFGNVTVDDSSAIVSVEEKPDFKLEVVAGLYCMDPQIFEFIPEGSYFGMDSLIKKLLSERKRIARFLIEDYWLDIGQVEDYGKAREIYAKTFGTDDKG